jgi:hypothetical protein
MLVILSEAKDLLRDICVIRSFAFAQDDKLVLEN